MGSHVSKPSNKAMVDRLYPLHIRTPNVESVFRAVDRAMYCELDEDEELDPYKEEPWRNGNLHLSAPCIYAQVVEALDLRPGLSFLNLGSGTGYLNTIIGLLIGPTGTNYGIEYHADVVEYANKRLEQFKRQSYAMDKYEFSEPIFIKGNFVNLDPNTRYDRIYLGAACLPDLEMFMKKLIKPNGGILVMPYDDNLTRYVRISESEWKKEKLMDVSFTLMLSQHEQAPVIEIPSKNAKSLKELSRVAIRQRLRQRTNSLNPNLLYSDNYESRENRKTKEQAKILIKQRAKERESLLKESKERLDSRKKWRTHKRQSSKSKLCICKCNCNSEASSDGRSIGSPRYFSSKSSTSTIPGTNGEEEKELRGEGGVMTRSATRKLRTEESLFDRGASTSKAMIPPKTSGNISSSSSDEDEDENDIDIDHFNDITQQISAINCARVRPFIHESSSPPISPSHAVPLLPFPLREHLNSVANNHPVRFHADYGDRQVVINWPAILGLHNRTNPNIPLGYLEQERSGLRNLNIPGDDDTTSRASWDSIFDNFTSNPLISDSDSSPLTPSFTSVLTTSCSSSSTDGFSEDEDDRDIGENDYDICDEDGEVEKSHDGVGEELIPLRESTDSVEPKPSTSRGIHHVSLQDQKCTKDKKPITKQANYPPVNPFSSDQEPVSTRLRSKSNAPSTIEKDDARKSDLRNHESCKDGGILKSCSAQRCKHKHNCPSHKCYRTNNQRQARSKHIHQNCAHHHTRNLDIRDSITPNSRVAQSRLNQNFSSTINPPQAQAAQHNHQQHPSLYTGRVLITAGWSGTLSLASRPYLPSALAAKGGGSLRLFGRGPVTRQSQPSGTEEQRKRKRAHTSSDSSDSSSSNSWSSCKDRDCSSCVRRCGECSMPDRRQARQNVPVTSPTITIDSSSTNDDVTSPLGVNSKLTSTVTQSTLNKNNEVLPTSSSSGGSSQMQLDTDIEVDSQSPESGSSSRTDLGNHGLKLDTPTLGESASDGNTSKAQPNQRHKKIFPPLDSSSSDDNDNNYHSMGKSKHQSNRYQSTGVTAGSSQWNHAPADDDFQPWNSRFQCQCRQQQHRPLRHQNYCHRTASSSSVELSGRRRREIKFETSMKHSMREAERKRRQKRRRRGAESEFERYHNHISSLVRQLRVPHVLQKYLNLERDW